MTTAAMADAANPYAGSRAGEDFNEDRPGGQMGNALVSGATPYLGHDAMAHAKSSVRAVIELKTLTACVIVGVLLLIIALIVFGGEKKNCTGGAIMVSFWLTLVAAFVFIGGWIYVAYDKKRNKYGEAAKRGTGPPGAVEMT